MRQRYDQEDSFFLCFCSFLVVVIGAAKNSGLEYYASSYRFFFYIRFSPFMNHKYCHAMRFYMSSFFFRVLI